MMTVRGSVIRKGGKKERPIGEELGGRSIIITTQLPTYKTHLIKYINIPAKDLCFDHGRRSAPPILPPAHTVPPQRLIEHRSQIPPTVRLVNVRVHAHDDP